MRSSPVSAVQSVADFDASRTNLPRVSVAAVNSAPPRLCGMNPLPVAQWPTGRCGSRNPLSTKRSVAASPRRYPQPPEARIPSTPATAVGAALRVHRRELHRSRLLDRNSVRRSGVAAEGSHRQVYGRRIRSGRPRRCLRFLESSKPGVASSMVKKGSFRPQTISVGG